MTAGTVKWFDPKKGYGFIVSDDVSGDIFVHWTKVSMEGFKKLEQGEAVEFTLVQTPAGKPQAESVVRTNPPTETN